MKAFMVIGLGFGDEGKGSIVDYLTREYKAKLVVRFNGGPQAAHNVVTPDSKHHTFSQFGSGTLAGAQTYLTHDVLVNPLNLTVEALHLKHLGISDPYSLLTIHPACKVITPIHIRANRLNRTTIEHGTCGQGIGEVMNDFIQGGPTLPFGLLGDESATRERLLNIAEYHELTYDANELNEIVQVYRGIHDSVNIGFKLPPAETVVFEGAQGVLLDEWYGFAPYTTWSVCLFNNAEVYVNPTDDVTRIGVMRAYVTRHGNGPMPTNSERLLKLRDEHNSHNIWQGNFRRGEFDTVLSRYAIAVSKPDYLAITCLDHNDCHFVSESYVETNELPIPRDNIEQAQLTKLVESATPIYRPVSNSLEYIKLTFKEPVKIESYGPTYLHKKEHVLA